MRLNKAVESIYYDTIRDHVGISGWCYDYHGNETTLRVLINDKEREISVYRRPLNYLTEATTAEPGFDIKVPLNGEPFKSVELWVDCAGETEKLVRRTKSQMRNWIIKKPILYNIDSMILKKDVLHFEGWVATLTHEEPEIYIENEKGEKQPYEITRIYREDVVRVRGLEDEHYNCGFHIRFELPESGDFALVFDDHINTPVKTPVSRAKLRWENFLIKSGYRKTSVYLKQNGIKQTIKKIFIKVFHIQTVKYSSWYKKIKFTEGELDLQRNAEFAYRPLISFVVPLYKTPEKFLRAMIESVQAQSYSDWELCLADGSGSEGNCEEIVKTYMANDPRIRYTNIGSNLGISGNSNAAIAMAKGDFVALVDHDDIIVPEAAYMIVEALNQDPEIEVLYSDEDKIDMKGKKFFEPNMKPDFSPDMLTAVNYICHLFVVKKTLLDRIGGFREEFNGAQDYDLILRATEATEHIKHIPRVLYHWRCHRNSTAQDPKSKLYAFEAGIRAIDEHYKRVGIPAHAEHGYNYGMYHTIFDWGREPKVSVLIPNKDHTDDLNVAINSLENVATYKNLEIIVIENNSTEEKTWEYYKKVCERYSNVKVVKFTCENGFNYSDINNYGEKFATGEYLLLLNNDVEIINPDTIQELLGYAMRKDVSAVGAQLFYPDDTTQHAGVVVGLGGVAGHSFPGCPKGDAAYMGRNLYANNYSAVTAACLMVEKAKFEEIGGLDNGLAVAFNDVDFCMRLRAKGWLIVYNPYATLYHYESKSRGIEDTPEKKKRFQKEVYFFRDRWKDELAKGDPYYNPNLTLDKNDFSLRNLYTNVELR